MPSLSSTPSTTTFSSVYLHPTPQSILTSLDAQFTLPPALLTDLTHAFLREINLGLKGYGEDMAMVPSFITGVPDGSETGTFLALDLGGTNLRVCQVTLNGDKTFKLRQQKYKVSEGLKTGEAGVLFDYLADSVDAFLTMHPPESPPLSPLDPNPNPNAIPDVLPLGLTFSFPVEQTALGAGTILTWTKGFSAKNAIGHDVVRLLQDAFDRKHLHVRCVALVNDTVGAMLSRAYTSGGCILGAIFGTGTNGAYLERVENIPKLTLTNPSFAENKENTGYMVVNTEWGAFNNTRTHLPYTPFDTALDRTSINPRAQAFEKFISGMYLGELTRGVLVALVDAVVRGDAEAEGETQGEGGGGGGTQTQAQAQAQGEGEGEGEGESGKPTKPTKQDNKENKEIRLRKTHSLLFNGLSTRVLNEKWALDTSVMSEVEEAWEAVDASSGTTENGGTGSGTTTMNGGTGSGTTLEGSEGMMENGGTGGGGAMEGGGGGGGGIGILNGGEGTPNEIGENPLWDGDDSGGLPDWEFLSGLDFTTTTTTTTPTPTPTNTNTNTTSTTPSANTNTKLRTKLERVRQVVVRRLGYEDGEVRLRDAAVGCFSFSELFVFFFFWGGRFLECVFLGFFGFFWVLGVFGVFGGGSVSSYLVHLIPSSRCVALRCVALCCVALIASSIHSSVHPFIHPLIQRSTLTRNTQYTIPNTQYTHFPFLSFPPLVHLSFPPPLLIHLSTSSSPPLHPRIHYILSFDPSS